MRQTALTSCLTFNCVQVGQFLAFDLEVSFAATDSSAQQQQQQQLELQVMLFALDAAAAAAGTGSNGVQSSGTPTAAAASSSSYAANSTDSIVDPGVLLTGCYNKLQVSITPGGKHTARLHALLVQPGLYVFGVADVLLVLQQPDLCGLDAAAAAAAGGVKPAGSGGAKAAADSGAPGRVYYNQDRLYVLVTR